MGEFDATIVAAGYQDTKITQQHASQKNRDGSQLSRDQKNKRENTWEQRKNRGIGWVGSQLRRDQNKKKEHMRAEKEEGGVGPS